MRMREKERKNANLQDFYTHIYKNKSIMIRNYKSFKDKNEKSTNFFKC